MSAARRTVLLDLTPLDTESRVRGIGRYLIELCRGLGALDDASRGELRLLGLTRLGFDGSYEVTEDIASFQGHARADAPTYADHLRCAYRKRWALAGVATTLGADLVHLGDPNATPWFRSRGGSNWLVTCHDLIAFHYPDRYFSMLDGGASVGRFLERRRYGSADRIVAISDATRADLVRFLGIEPGKIDRVYNGIDLDTWRGVNGGDEGPWASSLPARFVLYVGDADFRKNVEGMLSALSLARRQVAGLCLVWAGKLSAERKARVQELAQSLGVGDGLVLLGFVPDRHLLTLFRRARAHVFVSRVEGFGFTVAESMAAGCPVITSGASSLAEVAGNAALLVSPEDHVAIAEAMIAVSRDEVLRSKLIEAGLVRAQLFTSSVQAREMISVYQRALAAD